MNDSLQAWREHLIDAVLLGATLFATPVVIAGSINQTVNGNGGLVVLYVSLYLGLIVTTFLKRIGFVFRSLTIVAVFYLVGATEFWTGGLIGDGKIFFFGMIVLAGLLFELTGGIIATVVCLTTALLAAYRYLGTDIQPNLATQQVSSYGINWTTALLNLLLLSGTLTISINYLLRRLEAGRLAATELATQLSTEIDERIAAQSELARYQENLEELVQRRTEELHETQAELRTQESLASLGRLTTTISRELRTPLGTIHSSAFFLNRTLDHVDIPAQRALERIDRNVKRCDHIIEELVMFGKDEALQKERIELDLWLSRKLEQMHLDSAVPIELCLGAPGTFLFDDTQLFWCLRNLLTNAREAGGDDPSAVARTSRIRVRTECANNWISIYVEDDGPGFPPEDLANVFDPLYSAKGFGAGLGLPIARKIARIHGGDIFIASPGPHDTTVVIRFPAES